MLKNGGKAIKHRFKIVEANVVFFDCSGQPKDKVGERKRRRIAALAAYIIA
jgi:hypothetical protein